MEFDALDDFAHRRLAEPVQVQVINADDPGFALAHLFEHRPVGIAIDRALRNLYGDVPEDPVATALLEPKTHEGLQVFRAQSNAEIQVGFVVGLFRPELLGGTADDDRFGG